MVPISSIDEMGYADFLVRIHKADTQGFDGGEFSKIVDGWQVSV